MRKRRFSQQPIVNNYIIHGDVIVNGGKVENHNNQKTYYYPQPTSEETNVEDAVVNKEDYSEFSKERLAETIFNLQSYFWGRSSYAVVFCVLRDYFKFPNNQSFFEREIMSLPYKQVPDHVCAMGVVSSTFSDNPYMKLNVEKWKQNGASSRVMTLVNQIRNSLSAISE